MHESGRDRAAINYAIRKRVIVMSMNAIMKRVFVIIVNVALIVRVTVTVTHNSAKGCSPLI